MIKDELPRPFYRFHNSPGMLEIADAYREILARLQKAEKVITFYCGGDDGGNRARSYFRDKALENPDR